jgi:hypothetical protein
VDPLTVRRIERLDAALARMPLGCLVKVARALGVYPVDLVPGLGPVSRRRK